MRKFHLRIPLYARGDSGTIYIVFIMALIIAAAFVMVNGLTPEFDDTLTQQQANTTDPNQGGNGGLPPLPPKGSQQYQQQRQCAQKASKGLSNPQIAKRGSVKANCPTTP